MTAPTSGVVRIGNCSGFYGDRLSAMREMLEGGELDVLTGDYLAELTMLILGKDQLKDPSLGYARTFVRQLEDCLGLALEKGVRIVANSGGLNPAGLADKVREVAAALGLHPQVAHVEGDDVRHLSSRNGWGTPSPPTPTSAASASPPRSPRARTSSSPAGSPTPRSSSVRPSRTTAGPRRRTTSWRARSSPATSSSAAPRRRAATSAASSTCPTATGRSGSRSLRSRPTGRA